MKPKIIFMGTPTFACEILKRLLDEKYDVIAVVSQPDKKVGRKQIMTPTPVKELALLHHIEVYQPLKIKEDYENLIALQADLIVTCAYGQIIPQVLLDAPNCGSVNVHASLLPSLRGGAPIHKAILYGHRESGISIMRMIKKMDAGAVMKQSHVNIDDLDTMGTLSIKLAKSGCDLLMECLPSILDGSATFVDQEESKVSFAYNISKEEEYIHFDQDVRDVYNHMRALIPSPISYSLLNGKKIKFHKVSMMRQDHNEPMGKIVGMKDKSLIISAQNGYLLVEELQMEGKSKCDAISFYNGVGRNLIGSIFEA